MDRSLVIMVRLRTVTSKGRRANGRPVLTISKNIDSRKHLRGNLNDTDIHHKMSCHALPIFPRSRYVISRWFSHISLAGPACTISWHDGRYRPTRYQEPPGREEPDKAGGYHIIILYAHGSLNVFIYNIFSFYSTKF